jgi:hypothetical protein
MIYNLNNKLDKNKAIKRFEFLCSKGKKIDLKEKMFKRSLSQNAYLHLLLDYFAIQSGYTRIEAKELYKRYVCYDIYEYEKNGTKFYRSSADLDKHEFMKSIDRWIKYMEENGLDVPYTENEEHIDSAFNEVEKNETYL